MKSFALKETISREGHGLHSGAPSTVTLLPSSSPGIRFTVNGETIPAAHDRVIETRRGVTLGNGNASVKTVEHLLAAIRWLGIAALEIRVEGEEIPILDGSSGPWVDWLTPHLTALPGAFPEVEVSRPVSVQDGDSWIKAWPSGSLSVRYTIDYPGTPIGKQTWEGEMTQEVFRNEIAAARTFGFMEEAERLRSQGLAKGGNLETCVVITKDLILTPLRFKDEMVRHKVLDLLGDLSLLGGIPRAKIEAHKASHRLHTLLAAALEKNDGHRDN